MPPTPATLSTFASTKKKPQATPKRKKPLSKPRKVGPTAKGSAAPKGVRFRSRGPYKCTVNAEGKSCTGMHKALADAIGTGFDYDAAKRAGTLKSKEVPLPKADVFIPIGATKNERKLAYSKKQGCKLDQQVGWVLKIMRTHQLPLLAFFDKPKRDQVIKLKWGSVYKDAATVKTVRHIRMVANTLMPETEQILRYVHTHKLEIVGAQVPVASGKVGTCIDMVLRNAAGEDIPCELKNGCAANWQHGNMPAFLNSWVWTQFRHYQCQARMNARLYRKTFPDRKVGREMLMRPDRRGLSIYYTPPWLVEAEPALAARMRC